MQQLVMNSTSSLSCRILKPWLPKGATAMKRDEKNPFPQASMKETHKFQCQAMKPSLALTHMGFEDLKSVAWDEEAAQHDSWHEAAPGWHLGCPWALPDSP